jgi:hypothetical protein
LSRRGAGYFSSAIILNWKLPTMIAHGARL